MDETTQNKNTEQKQEETKDQQGTQEQNKQQEGTNKQQQQPEIDVEKVKSGAVDDYLKGLGVDSESIKVIVEKHKQDEEANKTELEKLQDVVTKTTKALTEEKELRMIAEAKLAAIKLGAKPDLVDDLVAVAKSRVTKDKNIDAVVAEIKSSNTGNIYFVSEEEQGEQQGQKKKEAPKKNITRQNAKQEQGEGAGENKNSSGDDLIDRIFEKKRQRKNHYFKK